MSKKLKILIFLSLFMLFTMILYVKRSYYKYDAVTLYPDDGTTKVKPQDPGGVSIPYSDSLVYNKLHSNSNNKVNLISLPEEPIEIVRNNASQIQFLDSIDDILDNIEKNEKELAKSDLIIVEESNIDANISVSGSDLNIVRSSDNRYNMLGNSNSQKDSGQYRIQLTAAYSMDDANKQMAYIKKKYPKILQNASLKVKKVKGKNGRIFFLVTAGDYPSFRHAKMVCKQFFYKKQNCIVIPS